MKLFLQNTTHGLIPCYDADYDEKKKLKAGKVYKVEIKLARNYDFHKKYFALINCAWEYIYNSRNFISRLDCIFCFRDKDTCFLIIYKQF
jgi:hypothetical protein